jgi:hypothetical protein
MMTCSPRSGAASILVSRVDALPPLDASAVLVTFARIGRCICILHRGDERHIRDNRSIGGGAVAAAMTPSRVLERRQTVAGSRRFAATNASVMMRAAGALRSTGGGGYRAAHAPVPRKAATMVREVLERLICDRCGKEGSTTVSFAVGRTTYELDLCEQDEARFNTDLGKWTGKARRSAGAGKRSVRASRRGGRDTGTAAIREWAKLQGLKVSDRGRVSADIIERYNASHS